MTNMNGATRTYNAANQMTNDGTNTLTYDANGNLTNDGVNSYTWDRANRLLSHGGLSYAYDGLGNRVSQDNGSVVTKYLLDTQPGLAKVLRESDGTNTNHYVHGLHSVHAQYDGSAWEYMMHDGLNSVRGLVDASAVVQQSISYGEYGDPDTSMTGFAFTGEQRDSNGLQYHRARYYDPALGIWVNLDPLETDNRYAYVSGNPINRADSSGLFDRSTCSVTSGDTLERIAVRDVGVRLESTGQFIQPNETSPTKRREAWEILYRYNQHISNPHEIVPGQRIFMPPETREGISCGSSSYENRRPYGANPPYENRRPYGANYPYENRRPYGANIPEIISHIDCPPYELRRVYTPTDTSTPATHSDTRYFTIGGRLDSSLDAVSGIDGNKVIK